MAGEYYFRYGDEILTIAQDTFNEFFQHFFTQIQVTGNGMFNKYQILGYEAIQQEQMRLILTFYGFICWADDVTARDELATNFLYTIPAAQLQQIRMDAAILNHPILIQALQNLP